MHPSRLPAARPLLFPVLSLAAALSLALGLPQRGLAQSQNGPSGTDSMSSPDGNPPVGVDTVGQGGAVATRNGDTTRRRIPAASSNPLVITVPTRSPDSPGADFPTTVPADNGSTSGNSTGSDNSTGSGVDEGGNSLLPPVITRQPRDYTLSTDPASFGPRRYARPLPLFGYDFFQPARQIIIARRRALLAPPVTPRRTNVRTSRNPPGGVQATSAGNSGQTGNSSQTENSDQAVNGRADGGDAGSVDSSAYPGGVSDLSAAGTALGAAAVAGRGAGSPSADSGADVSPLSGGADAVSRQAAGGAAGADAGLNDGLNTGGDVTGGTTPRRRQAASADTFSGDAAAPLGSGEQFPGDDALAQSGAANAITGQIADPLSTLSQNVLASLPPNYQLQPGDSLTVRYSALTLAPREFTTTVDLSGGVDVAGVGRISVAGRTASQAEEALRQRLERLYRNVDVSISLRQLRTIQVTVSGAAFAPGTYTVPATATAFNVLNAAGGPTADGSLREIRVLRGGRLAGTLDIYPLIGATSGGPRAGSGDIALQSGDNIYIPARLSRIAVRGEVRQQAIFELTPAQTLRDALNYAGGVKPSGVDQNVHIDTVNSGTGRVIRDVNLRDRAAVVAIRVYDGDTIEVSSVRAILTNRVTVEGAVDQPGDYALTPGMRVSDLIARARGPLYDAYLGRADLTRLNADNTTTLRTLSIAGVLDGDAAQNVALRRFDRLRLYTRQEVAYLGRRVVTVRGAVQRPGLYTQSDNMRVSDLLLETGGPLPDAYLSRAVLLHQRGDGTYAYDYIDLRGVLSGNADADAAVGDNDVLAVYRIGEAHFTPDHTVKVLGDVVAPGLYARGDRMRLSDLLKLAGAFKPGGGTRVTVAHARRPVSDPVEQVAPTTVAYNGQQVATAGTDMVLQDGDVVAVQGNGGLQDHPAVVTVTGLVNRPGPIIVKQGERLSDAIREAGGLRPDAFPQGAEFTRTAASLVTGQQLDLTDVINQMSNMLNLSQYQRERAKANLALIEAAGSAAAGSTSGLAIPGLGGAAASSNAANPNLAPLIATLPQNNPVSPGRLLTPSQLQPNGGVAVQLAAALRRPGGPEDVLLKDGDTLVVPETPTTVQVVGAVFNTRSVLFRAGQSIDYYIQRAGDFTPDAARDRIEVIHAGGGLIPAGKAGALQPGDLILVPTKVLAEKVGRSGSGFSDFFQGLVGSAITLKVLSSVFGL